MLVDYTKLSKKLANKAIAKPISGTLSGHSAGESFDKLVYKEIKNQLPKYTFRQYEYLNDLYSKNPNVIGHHARLSLFNSPTILFLLSRGKNATNEWSSDNLFEEKQNDTADILVVKDDFYEIIDVKTRNIAKRVQPPNIISAYKLAHLCAKMIDNEEFNNFTINYFEIDWYLDENELVCKDTHFANLFKSEPNELYINWSAAMQIQFHVSDVGQLFKGTAEEWAKLFIKHFVEQARKRANDMIERFVVPFEKYLS